MSCSRRAWIVAACVATVEAMKDQGFCRWNYTLRSLQQHAKNNMRSLSLDSNKKLSSASLVSRTEKAKLQSEESLRKVMYLSCWGPN